MRKKTAPRTRKQNQASSCETSGLIAKDKNRRQSVGKKSVLDNRSHRTIALIERYWRKLRARPGAARQFYLHISRR